MFKSIPKYALIILLIPFVQVLAGQALVDSLYNNNGWEKLLVTDEGIQIKTKSLEGYELKALEISQVVDVTPQWVIEVLEDVDSYNDVLADNRNMICNLVDQDENTIIGYQFYKIPFMRNRYVVFEMKKKHETESGQYKSEWTLVPEEVHPDLQLPDFHYEESPLSIDEGAGIWIFEQMDTSWHITHRLYMNPGGWIPNFIVERVNRKGVAELFKDVIQAAKQKNELADLVE